MEEQTWLLFKTEDQEEATEVKKTLEGDGIEATLKIRSDKGVFGINWFGSDIHELYVRDGDVEKAQLVLKRIFPDSVPKDKQDKIVLRETEKSSLIQRIRGAKISSAVILLCIVIFSVINIEYQILMSRNVFRYLALDISTYWSGAIWVLVTSAFIHVGIFHLFFNMYWAWVIGSRVERSLTICRYVILILTGAIVSYSFEVLVVQQASIGYSGVVYAFVGYGTVAGLVGKAGIITRGEKILFFVWLFAAIIFTRLNFINIANWGHIGGLLAGAALGWMWFSNSWRILAYLPVAVLLLVSVSSLYMPWSETWVKNNEDISSIYMMNKANAGDPDSQSVYGRWLVTDSNTVIEGEKYLRKSASGGSVKGMNNLAWYLATTPDETKRDGAEAVKWATLACEETLYQDGFKLDTLAAAYAESGQWDDAVEYQKLAIQCYESGKRDVLKGMRERLNLYHSGQTYVEPYQTE